MGSQSKVWVQRVYDPLRPAREYALADTVLDEIVDAGYDFIVLQGPNYRLVATVEDWLDFGTPDIRDGVDVTRLRTARMEKS